MELSLAAYRMLVAIAQMEGGVEDDEKELLSRYRRALGLPAELEERELASSQCGSALLEETTLWRQASSEERRHLVRMLIRVGFADGVLGRRELRKLKRVAAALGISSFEFGGLVVDVEDELHRHHRGRTKRRVAAVVLVVGGGLSAVLAGRGIGSLFSNEVEATPDTSVALKAVEERARSALLLLQVDFLMRGPDGESRRRGTGTGFFLTPDGLIGTNKHVLEPWKFDGPSARLRAAGYRPVPSETRIVAYPVDARVRSGEGRRDTSEAYDTEGGTLRIVGFAPDEMTERELSLPDGREVQILVHDNSSADLALLRAEVRAPVTALSLRGPEAPVATLEPVLVLGFPAGTGILERGLAHPTVARGDVSRVEDTLLIQAPLLSGSSGGPVLDVQGRVVGVATRKLDGATFGRCIQTRYVGVLASRCGQQLPSPLN